MHGGAHRPTVLKTVLGPPRYRAKDHVLEIRRHIAVDITRLGDLYAGQQLMRGRVGQPSRGHLVEKNADRVDVADVPGALPLERHLRGHVRLRAVALGPDPHILEPAARPEVGDLRYPGRLVDKDVLRLQVVVRDVRGVDSSKTVEDLHRPLQHLFERERRTRTDAVEDLRQVVAIDELHLDYEELADVVEAVDANDVRVTDFPDDL